MTNFEQHLGRIIAALRFRTGQIFVKPPVSEVEFIRATGNHGEFRAKLKALGQARTSEQIKRHAHYVGLCWFWLSLEHLEDARCALAAGRARATFSRSYYAAYNASKAIRYIADGAVSLKGDDHHNASSGLPDDFPDVDRWSAVVTDLYEHRLRADYDNWESTAAENLLTTATAFDLASDFLDRCRLYLSSRLGARI
jgi:HEPN domain